MICVKLLTMTNAEYEKLIEENRNSRIKDHNQIKCKRAHHFIINKITALSLSIELTEVHLL